jgi:hypothetical protein
VAMWHDFSLRLPQAAVTSQLRIPSLTPSHPPSLARCCASYGAMVAP